MPKTAHLKPRHVAPHAYEWSKQELEEMKAIIESLLASLEEEEEELPEFKGYGGKSKERGSSSYFELKLIRGYGPYRYLRYRIGSTLKSVYVGKA